jgi:hypothetical protein
MKFNDFARRLEDSTSDVPVATITTADNLESKGIHRQIAWFYLWGGSIGSRRIVPRKDWKNRYE